MQRRTRSVKWLDWRLMLWVRMVEKLSLLVEHKLVNIIDTLPSVK